MGEREEVTDGEDGTEGPCSIGGSVLIWAVGFGFLGKQEDSSIVEKKMSGGVT